MASTRFLLQPCVWRSRSVALCLGLCWAARNCLWYPSTAQHLLWCGCARGHDTSWLPAPGAGERGAVPLLHGCLGRGSSARVRRTWGAGAPPPHDLSGTQPGVSQGTKPSMQKRSSECGGEDCSRFRDVAIVWTGAVPGSRFLQIF